MMEFIFKESQLQIICIKFIQAALIHFPIFIRHLCFSELLGVDLQMDTTKRSV